LRDPHYPPTTPAGGKMFGHQRGPSSGGPFLLCSGAPKWRGGGGGGTLKKNSGAHSPPGFCFGLFRGPLGATGGKNFHFSESFSEPVLDLLSCWKLSPNPGFPDSPVSGASHGKNNLAGLPQGFRKKTPGGTLIYAVAQNPPPTVRSKKTRLPPKGLGRIV